MAAAKRKRRGKPPRLGGGNNPLRHIPEMRTAFPIFTHRIGRDREVVWFGQLQPNADSGSYRIKVVYRLFGPPKVFVLSPAPPANAPHRYSDGSLCLYWPKEWRWSDSESIAATIMVWAALWLEYYEIWQAVGVWLGPSSHEEFPKENDDD